MVRSTVNGILPYVFSYISHFVCLYNFNYTGRPLCGPGIIGILHQILPEEIANSLSPKSSRLAHLYGLPKTHKATLSMRPILSATGTYNYNLARWLEQKLKPLSLNKYTITDAFAFADEIRTHTMNEDDILVSYDVTALFTNVP